MNINKINSHEPLFRYQLLSRMKMDCEWFLGNGARNVKRLWAGNVVDHIAIMKGIYNELPDIPEWISDLDILEYEYYMTKEL